MSVNRLLGASLKFLQISGMDPRDNDNITKIKRFVFILTNIILYIDFLLICLFDWKGFDSIAEVTIYLTFVHIGYKLSSLMVKQQRFVAIFNSMDKFTKWESLHGEIKEDVDKSVDIFTKIIRIFKIIIVTAGMGYCLLPFLVTSKRITPLETHFSKYYGNTGFYIIAYIVHTFDLFLSVITILGYDILYITLISTINIEIRIIKHRIRNLVVEITDEDKMDEISQIVLQHNLVLRVIRKCNRIYSDILLVQFSSSIIFLSTALFSVMDSGRPLPMGIVDKSGFHLSASMSQLFLYCTLGQMLINQTQSISDTIYNIKWWVKPQPKLRQACILMIQRSNKLECLTAAGTFTVNYESYTKVLKFGLSLFSLTHAMKARDDHVI